MLFWKDSAVVAFTSSASCFCFFSLLKHRHAFFCFCITESNCFAVACLFSASESCLLNIIQRTGNKGLASLLDVELSSDIFQALEESACRAACRSTNRSAVLTCVVVFAFAESGGCCVMRVFKQALGLLILKNKLFH